MTLDARSLHRYSRQIAMAGLGVPGQERIQGARVLLAGTGLAMETGLRYLAAAGVQRFCLLTRVPGETSELARILCALDSSAAAEFPTWPADGAAWLAALRGSSLGIRLDFDDDPMLRAAVSLGVPLVAVRGGATVDVVSMRVHGPCPHLSLDVPARPAAAPPGDAAGAVLAGALAAAEALDIILRPGAGPRARRLSLSLAAGVEPLCHEIPWSPECFLCGGQATEAILP